MKIADKAVGTPATRGQPLQSTPSRASAASTWSPFASSPAGPPSGPASAARPPSRAIATAALAAQPPLTTKNLLACTLPSGGGKLSTRNTSSSTVMPAHRMRGGSAATPASIKDIAAAFDEVTDDVVGDGDGRRRGEALRVLAQQHHRQLLAIEPAGIFELGPVDHDVVRQRLGVTAD